MKTKTRYSFIEFLRPDSYWPTPYTIEQAFGVFRWLAQTGYAYEDKTRWGVQNIFSLLSGNPTCVNFSEVDPIRSVADLRRRFHYAFLSSYLGPNLQRWREEHGIRPDGEKVIAFPHHAFDDLPDSNANCCNAIDALLGASGFLRKQLNNCHRDAREIDGVELTLGSRYSPVLTWRFRLRFGVDGSRWYRTLAESNPNEPFLHTFRRASQKLHDLTGGKWTEEEHDPR